MAFTGVTKTSFASTNQILFNVQNQMSVGVQVSDAASVTVDGKKIVKAGTPLTGDLKNRLTAFTVSDGTAASGVLLHDVDVTSGAGNGILLIWGFVNLNRLDTATQALITTAVETALSGKVTFLKD